MSHLEASFRSLLEGLRVSFSARTVPLLAAPGYTTNPEISTPRMEHLRELYKRHQSMFESNAHNYETLREGRLLPHMWEDERLEAGLLIVGRRMYYANR